MDRLVLLERGFRALAALVRDEYPQGLSLGEIARRWRLPEVTEEQIDALDALEE